MTTRAWAGQLYKNRNDLPCRKGTGSYRYKRFSTEIFSILHRETAQTIHHMSKNIHILLAYTNFKHS